MASGHQRTNGQPSKSVNVFLIFFCVSLSPGGNTNHIADELVAGDAEEVARSFKNTYFNQFCANNRNQNR